MLVRLDDSAESEVVTKYVLKLASGYRASVTGLFVRRPPPVEIPPDAMRASAAALAVADVEVGSRRQWDAEQHALNVRLFDDFRSAGKVAGVATRVATRTGWAVEEITAAARTADLVGIARSVSEGGRVGSLLEGLVRAVPHPFLVAGEPADLARVAVAYDGSKGACRALACAADLVSGLSDARPEVLVIEVVPRGGVPIGLLGEAQGYLELYGIPARGLLVNGDPASALTEIAKQENVDLLCMGAYGHWVLRDILLGSTTQAVIERRARPLLLCH